MDSEICVLDFRALETLKDRRTCAHKLPAQHGGPQQRIDTAGASADVQSKDRCRTVSVPGGRVEGEQVLQPQEVVDAVGERGAQVAVRETPGR